jgi:hypothetical protein
VHREQPDHWYELRLRKPSANLKKTSRRWRLRKVGGDSGASERSVERQQAPKNEEFESIRCRMRNCAGGSAEA